MKTQTPFEAFQALLNLGLWPIGLYPQGAMLPGRNKKAEGKEPYGKEWGLELWTVDRWQEAAKRYGNLGVGICLGPGRGPGGTWLIDIEGDGPEAEESRVKLYGGEVVESLGWSSVRGGHGLLIADVNRLAEIIPGLKELEVKRASPGVYKSPAFPSLELRLGGYKSDAAKTIKQIHSAVPPTRGTDGTARTWTDGREILEVPEPFYEALASLQKAKAVPRSRPVEPVVPARARDDDSADERWANAALAAEWESVASAASGERNNHLVRSAFKLGQLVPRYLDRSTVEATLRTACIANKLDPGEVDPTIRSGLEAGMASPRVREERVPVRPRHDEQSQSITGPRLAEIKDDDGDGPPEDNAPPPVDEVLPWFNNFQEVSTTEGKVLSLASVAKRIHADRERLSPGWPKRVRDRLFVRSGSANDPRPNYLNSATKLFAYLDGLSHVDWRKGSKFIPQERFYEFEKMNVEEFESIEVLPHVPPFPNAFYMHPDIPDPSGKLEILLDKFLPLEPLDRHLITALILTPLWGGPSGSRPAFLVTGSDQDVEQGRGLGKSTLVDLISDGLFGGSISVKQDDDMGKVKTRMLSAEGESRRLARLDNIKSFRFSWGDLEDLITTNTISGHTLYLGEGSRRNDLTWTITLNGASLSKDMAQRVVTIKIRRPDSQTGESWRENVMNYMQQHRWSIISDAMEILRREPGEIKPVTRWKSWEHNVLSKLPMAIECQMAIVDRQNVMDDGNQERDLVRQTLCKLMEENHFTPDAAHLFISSQKLAEIVSYVMRKHYDTCQSSSFVKQLSIPELTPKRSNIQRGWIWKGRHLAGGSEIDFHPEVPGWSGSARR